MAKNAWAKLRKVEEPYAVWRANGWEWRVLKAYQTPEAEARNAFARWHCAVKSPFTYRSWERGDTYVKDVTSIARLVSAESRDAAPVPAPVVEENATCGIPGNDRTGGREAPASRSVLLARKAPHPILLRTAANEGTHAPSCGRGWAGYDPSCGLCWLRTRNGNGIPFGAPVCPDRCGHHHDLQCLQCQQGKGARIIERCACKRILTAGRQCPCKREAP